MANEHLGRGGQTALKQVLKRKYWRESDARLAVDAALARGGGVAGFAAQHGLDVRRLQRWQRRLAAGGVPGGAFGEGLSFLPVRVADEPPVPSRGPVELIIGRYVLRLSGRFDAEQVEQLLDLLERRVG